MRRYQLQRRRQQMRGAVAPMGLELEHNLAGGVGLHALVGQCRACDVAAQLFQRLAVVSPAAQGSMQAEPADVSAQVLLELRIPGRDALQRQHLLASAWAESDAVGTGRGLSARTSSESPSLSAT